MCCRLFQVLLIHRRNRLNVTLCTACSICKYFWKRLQTAPSATYSLAATTATRKYFFRTSKQLFHIIAAPLPPPHMLRKLNRTHELYSTESFKRMFKSMEQENLFDRFGYYKSAIQLQQPKNISFNHRIETLKFRNKLSAIDLFNFRCSQ